MNIRGSFGLCLVVCGFVLLAGLPVTGEEDAIRVAETMLLYQRDCGGWPKNYDTDAVLDDDAKAKIVAQKHRTDATLDNGATHREVRALSEAYARTGDQRFQTAALRGIEFMLDAQYANGGWPQRYPQPSGYAKHITFNDSAMIGVMTVLRDVALGEVPYEFVNNEIREQAREAVEKGIDCILRCQIVVDGTKTAWCAQHDEETLAPAKARSYELPSLSGAESVKIVQFLMDIDEPSPQVVDAIESAVAWFDKAKVVGQRLKTVPAPGTRSGRDRVVVSDPTAPPLWARFYEIGTNRPFFCSRDGVPKYRLAEISYERRTGYSWLGTYAATLLERDYPAWQKKHDRPPSPPLAFPGAEG
jgi:PelA/Pel-15E family pectate lyase